jgi:hypothetical protein
VQFAAARLPLGCCSAADACGVVGTGVGVIGDGGKSVRWSPSRWMQASRSVDRHPAGCKKSRSADRHPAGCKKADLLVATPLDVKCIQADLLIAIPLDVRKPTCWSPPSWV